MKRLVITVCAMALMPASALGQSRATRSYELTFETVDGGGSAAVGSSYAMQASFGGFGEVVIAPAAGATLKGGYVGQIYNVTGLQLRATPDVVAEGGRSQLSATALLDDSSGLGVGSDRVAWQIVRGPVLAVAPDGSATIGSVYTTSSATVRGEHLLASGTLDLIVLDVGLDDYGLYANDGIADTWQVDYFGPDNPAGLAHADPDKDGPDNLGEALAGTSPVDPDSKFRLVLGSRLGSRQTLSFSPRLPNRVYTVQYTTNLGTTPFAPLTGVEQTDHGLTRTATDTNAVGGVRFYRIRIAWP